MKIRIGKCVDCGEVTIIAGRDLCHSRCYSYHHKNGSLDNFPRSTWKNAELMAELELCRARGLTVRQAATKIGVTYTALRKAMHRARRRELAAVGARSS